MAFISDLFADVWHIVAILPWLMVVTLLVGKRSISELPVFDFLVIIALGVVVGVHIILPESNYMNAAFALSIIGLFQRIFSRLVLRFRMFGRLFTFEPTVVIKDGKFLTRNMKKTKYTIDNILNLLREKDVFDVSEVDYAIIEANGKLTVQRKPHKLHVTPEDLSISKKGGGISYPVLVEGKVYPNVLSDLQLDEKWLKNQLNKRGIMNMNEIFFASVNEQKELYVSMNGKDQTGVVKMMH